MSPATQTHSRSCAACSSDHALQTQARQGAKVLRVIDFIYRRGSAASQSSRRRTHMAESGILLPCQPNHAEKGNYMTEGCMTGSAD